MKVKCPVCDKLVSGYVPKGGDGSVLRPRKHGDCDGRFYDVDLAEAERESNELPKTTEEYLEKDLGYIPAH
jgi:hypothetical protein